jgi:hypothetical protein
MQIHRITRRVQKNARPECLPARDCASQQRQFRAASANADREPGPFAQAAARFLDWRDREKAR